MRIFSNFIRGILIGAGAIIPGVSSGVLCMIMGIYEKLLDSVIYFFEDIKGNLTYILPFIVGGIIGVTYFSSILSYLLYTYPIQIKSIFIGLVLGGTPYLIKEANNKNKEQIEQIEQYSEKKNSKSKKSKNIVENIKLKKIEQLINYSFLVITLLLSLLGNFIENYINLIELIEINNVYLFICGILTAIGYVLPGVSSTVILMGLGIYQIYLYSISTIYTPVLIPFALGAIIGSLVWMKITKKLFKNYYAKTQFAIIGFTIGSAFVLIPDIYNVTEGFICILSIVLGFNIIKILTVREIKGEKV